jgi:asparagine synthase (glutamine-hydrolysing)
MCGIAGIVQKKCSNINQEIATLNSHLKHRGPDDEGYVLISNQDSLPLGGKDTPAETLNNQNYYCPKALIEDSSEECNLALAHRRLSIIDVSTNGHQPMCSTDKQLWIVLNGEIYNYIELKQELINQGYRFHTASDTEVVLVAYKMWGQECVNHFNGMWAFVIYDADKNILFGSRDRLGVKPLYYYKSDESFVFASEQKALWHSKIVKSGLNSRAVFDYLALSHSDAEPESFFQNIISMQQGYNFVFEINNFIFQEYCYYTSDDLKDSVNNLSVKEESERLLELVTKAVNIRTRADVEIGACLSGGIDSSFIVMLLDKYFKEKNIGYSPQVFTAVYSNYKYDEEKWAQQVVNSTSVKWHKTYPTSDTLLSDLSDLIYAADTPLLSTSTYAQYKVMKLASEQGIKVLLDGQGADELFAGYNIFNKVYYNELFVRFKFVLLFKEINSTNNFFTTVKNWITTDIQMLLKRTPSRVSKYLYEKAIFELKFLTPDFKNEYLKRFGNLFFPFNLNLNDTLKKYASGERLQVMLQLEDRMSMRFSVESRTPFSDDLDLINYGLSLPSSFKIKNGVRKYILREAGKNIIPNQILERKDKIGFQTPEYDWLKSLKNEIPLLLESNINEYVNTGLIKENLKLVLENPTSDKSSRILRFIFLSQWRKIYKI